MEHGRTQNILRPFVDDIFHLAPIPIVYHQLQRHDLEQWNQGLIQDARRSFSEQVLEVPDIRHITQMGSLPQFNDATWSEEQIPAVGIWHNVPTNGFLDLDSPGVKELKMFIEHRYLNALKLTGANNIGEARVSESWIQFYKAGDYKVLHNHERYGPPHPDNRWVGSYYIDDGDPDSTMPYSGVLSFRVRQVNYYLRPRGGLLVMWPSDILHQVHPFYGSRERVVVNLNINTRARS